MSNAVAVLIVEDSEPDAELLVHELRRGGRDVRFKRVDTEPAFLAALEDSWDIIISDYAMPTFDGLSAFRLYKESNLDIPFIFVSGALGEERAVEAMKAGARDYILKDNLSRLNIAVDRALEEARTRRLKRAADAANLKEQKRLAVALHATGAGVFEYRIPTDRQGHCNARFAEILGYAPAELPDFERFPAWLLQQVHPEDFERVKSSQDAFTEGRSNDYAIEFRIRHKDGGWREVSCLAEAAERDAAGKVTDLVGVMLDRTEQRRMEEQFRQAQKMEAIGRLAGGVAHDFNNLLTVILNFGDFVLESIEPNSASRQDMQEVLNAAGRAEKLTGQLLAFSRRQPVDPKVLNINDLVGDVDKMLRRLLGEDIVYETKLEPDIWNVRVDAGGLEQVIVNLAINARDAMPDGGTLSIETRNVDVRNRSDALAGEVPAGQYVVISVDDTGTGMDADTQRRIFEPFFTTKAPDKGTGLGLATCYGIVQQVGGFIGVDSEPGSGTTFTVFLPREAADADETVIEATGGKTEQKRADADAVKHVVLLVEDEPSVRKLVARVLSGLGYELLVATNGAEALEVAQSARAPISLVLSDVVMPKMSGPELIERLAGLYPQMKAVLMSGYTRGTVDLGGQIPMLRKPFSPQVLIDKVREVLSAP